MKIKKRIISIITVLIMVVMIAGGCSCNGKGKTENTVASFETGKETETSANASDTTDNPAISHGNSGSEGADSGPVWLDVNDSEDGGTVEVSPDYSGQQDAGHTAEGGNEQNTDTEPLVPEGDDSGDSDESGNIVLPFIPAN